MATNYETMPTGKYQPLQLFQLQNNTQEYVYREFFTQDCSLSKAQNSHNLNTQIQTAQSTGGKAEHNKKNNEPFCGKNSAPVFGCTVISLANSIFCHVPVSETQKDSALAQGKSSITLVQLEEMTRVSMRL